MADDQTQRPYRSNEAPARGQPAKAAGSVSGNDPLAELARLIGQSDPFSEFGRDGVRRAAPRPAPPIPSAPAVPGYPPQTAAPAPGVSDYSPTKQAPAAPSEPAMFGAANFGRQPFGSAPLAADMYQVDSEPAAYAEPGFEHDSYQPADSQPAPAEDDYYDDGPSNRRRIGIMAIAGVFALAVIGTAGAFGYRAIFGSSSSTTPPPVIKAETAPSKVVPATPGKDSQSSKLITDRVNERGQGEKLVSREETPVAINKPANVVFPQAADGSSTSSTPQLGSGIVGSEPKRIRTIAIHPDQGTTARNEPAPPPAPAAEEQAPASAPAPAPARIASAPPPRQPAQPTRLTPQVTTDAEPPPPAQRPSAPVRVASAPPANAPLSLSPNAAPARASPAARTAAVAPPARPAPAAPNGAAGSYAVQVSSQRSEADAQAAFQSLQAKYPGQLGGKQVFIRKVELGAKGTYYRAMVGPFASSGAAVELCSSLKSAGGQCIVQKN